MSLNKDLHGSLDIEKSQIKFADGRIKNNIAKLQKAEELNKLDLINEMKDFLFNEKDKLNEHQRSKLLKILVKVNSEY